MKLKPASPVTLFTLKKITPITCILLAACSTSNEEFSQDTQESDELTSSITNLIIDASAYDHYTYLNLNTGDILELSESQAASSDNWHIGFKRTSVILNGGTSGPGNVAGAVSAPQEDFYDDQGEPLSNVFLNTSPEQEEEHLDPSIDIGAFNFVSDSKLSAIQGSRDTLGTNVDMGWYFYNFVTHQLSLNSDAWWLLRSNSGDSYAKFHATSFSYNSVDGLAVTFDFDVQATQTSQFNTSATFDANISATGGESCFDFDTNTAVACDADDWDIRLEISGRDWNLWTNSGISGDGAGGAFGPFTQTEIDDYRAGNISPDGTNIDTHYTADMNAGIFNENLWYAYNLEGRHKLWPNYRSYIIDTNTTDSESPKYQLQITNYYSEAGVSGHPNISFIEVKNEAINE